VAQPRRGGGKLAFAAITREPEVKAKADIRGNNGKVEKSSAVVVCSLSSVLFHLINIGGFAIVLEPTLFIGKR